MTTTVKEMHNHKLILGTVQLGLDYGINNRSGRPSRAEAYAILDLAAAAGLGGLDTAAAYGEAEQLIGDYRRARGGSPLPLITKFHYDSSSSPHEQLSRSLQRLAAERVDVLLFHSFADYRRHPELLPALQAEQAAGRIGLLGVSVYTADEIEALIDQPAIAIIQAPFNLLDNEHYKGGVLRRAQAAGKIIHTRSVFLQGLFFKPPHELPAQLQPLAGALQLLRELQQAAGCSMQQLALGYVLSKPYIGGVLIGVDSSAQLAENLAAAGSLPAALVTAIDALRVDEPQLLNPANWAKG